MKQRNEHGRAKGDRPPQTLIELLTRDLEAWRLAKGVITKARSYPANVKAS